MKYIIIIGVIIAVSVIAALVYFAFRSKGNIMDGPGMINSYKQITQEEARDMMKKDDGHIIVDVRRQDEYDSGHIPGAVCIPNESISDTQPEELPDLKQIILVYCRSGRRSKEAAQKLFDMGYSNIFEFGGIIDWTGETVTGNDDTESTIEAIRPRAVLVIDTGKSIMYATLEDNDSAKEFAGKLSPAPISVDMHDYGNFEKVGDLPWKLPVCDEEIAVGPGDIILYQGNKIAIYYDQNTYNFTRLARIGGKTREELLEILGGGDVTVSFYLEWSE